MNQIIRNLYNPGDYSPGISVTLLVARIIVGAFMLSHGIGKFNMLFAEGPIQFADPIGIGEAASLVLAVFAEVFCSLFLILGFSTRFSAIPLIITMLVAAFVVHSGDGFGRQELPLLYTLIYFIFVVFGAGKISVDNWLYQRFLSK